MVFTSLISGVLALASLLGAKKEADAQEEQGKYQEHMYEVNAKLAEDQGADAIKIGNLTANAQKKQAEQIKGSQRASYAAQGVDVNSGVAAEVQADTDTLSALDEIEIKENAWREAWGYRVQAIDSRSKGQFSRQAGDNASKATLLTGGLKALTHVADAYGKSLDPKAPKASAPKISNASSGWDSRRGPGAR